MQVMLANHKEADLKKLIISDIWPEWGFCIEVFLLWAYYTWIKLRLFLNHILKYMLPICSCVWLTIITSISTNI